MKYDDFVYHVDDGHSDFQSAAHIGLFFRWCVLAGLVSHEHISDPECLEALNKVRAGTLTGTEYVLEFNSGKLADVDLNQEGNAFAKHYYGKRYYSVLSEMTGAPDYQFTEPEIDAQSLFDRLDAALQDWRRNPPRPWWKFWARVQRS